MEEKGLKRSELLNPQELAAKTFLPEDTVRSLLEGSIPPADTVNDRVRARIKAMADDYLTRTGTRMAGLASSISRQLGVSAFWARQVCTGDKVPSVELLHGLVSFFKVEGGEAVFTAEAPEALNRALLPLLARLQPSPGASASSEPLTVAWPGHDDVRGIALRQAQNLPPERWNVLNATLKALLDLDDKENQ
ncbi:hypothetical protein [Streptomyces luteogriseus]|uniref:hypothetical protein n=1 Tax=Streptomyces luteogriseus TaxID=68233 RepID=UPI003787F94F